MFNHSSDSMIAEGRYWEQIEQYFVQKRGSALILSPKDWPLVTSWQERKIPIEVIFEGIDKAFLRLEEKHPSSSRRRIRSLTSCQHDIEEAWKSWQERHPEHPEYPNHDNRKPVALEHQKLITKLHSSATQLQKYAETPHYSCIRDELIAASEALKSFLSQVEHVQDQPALTRLKEDIRTIEHQLAATLEQAIGSETRQMLYAKAEARLASHKHNMKEQVYQETLDLAFRQELRNAYPLPSFL